MDTNNMSGSDVVKVLVGVLIAAGIVALAMIGINNIHVTNHYTFLGNVLGITMIFGFAFVCWTVLWAISPFLNSNWILRANAVFIGWLVTFVFICMLFGNVDAWRIEWSGVAWPWYMSFIFILVPLFNNVAFVSTVFAASLALSLSRIFLFG